ncbi:MAG: YfhL family 4Fe-4S dicluster ferredoxin [Chloroflexi bacterium]|nr:YfhL family 4Fe-4S dicluster ferredoxin [Chloroflexota bacterium]
MAYMITEDCLDCGACEWECEVNHAIDEGKTKRGQPIYVVDPAKCTECVGSFESPRCVAVCPVDAILKNPKHVENKAQLLAKWQSLHPGQQPVAGTY